MEKKDVFDIKNFIETSTGNSRLKSLRVPRDLNLGAGKPSKKFYAPNLNVIRKKDKTKEFIKKELVKREKSFNGKLNRNNLKDRYVQSAGVFSEGSADARRSVRAARSYVRDNDAVSSMAVPTIKRNTWKINKKDEDIALDEIMGCEDDEVQSDDEKTFFKPVNWNENDLKEVKVNFKSVKIEDNLQATTPAGPNFKLSKQRSSMFLPSEFDDEESYNDDNPNLTLWNLPDSFAGKGLSDDPNVKTLFDYTLNDMLEGKIGKICIRKSGKMYVHIGRVKYNLDSSELAPCIEQLISLGITDSYSQPAAAVIGQIQNRFQLNPDWDSLLK